MILLQSKLEEVNKIVTNDAIVIHTQRLKSDPGVICSPDSGELMVTFETVMEIKILHKQ
ncbi:hypothetical protein ECP029894210_4937 [Escherichia coli P0298942.10]|nr:hypothetical protein ECP02989421_5088 [Escherichia coli P0298942.1]ENB46896.1 hypothetical protein ECP029894211_3305 [Escherichia coli P0298942.11]ENB48260.1 hypothetical protein ECP029894210_4937 [Escherichia coli P0298942.10]ENB90538.1 hypothetical protein ECP02989429_4807 [Escherichia coli P0298942.9]